jgi:hypothetical protein
MAIVTALLAILGGLGLTLGWAWRWVGDHLVTMTHEGGHAAVALLSNHGRVGGIELHTHIRARRTGQAGVTHTATTRKAMPWVAAAGYPAPAALGLSVLALLHSGHGKGALAALVGSLALMLVLVRTLFGAFLVFTVGAALYLAFLYGGPEPVQGLVLGTFAWALLFGAVRDAVAVLFMDGDGGDAAGLAAITALPARAWSTLFVLLTAGAAAYALWLTVTAWI